MNTKSYYTILGICLASAFSTGALAATQTEANAQLDLIPVTATRQAAHEVLNNLVSAGAPVAQALAVVSDAVKHNYSAAQLRQVGAEISEQTQQKIPAAYAIKTADKAINANYTVAKTIKALNSLRDKVNQGKSAEQAYASVNSSIANNNFDDADNHHSAGSTGANMATNAGIASNAGMAAHAGMTSNAGAAANAAGMGAKSFGGVGAGMRR